MKGALARHRKEVDLPKSIVSAKRCTEPRLEEVLERLSSTGLTGTAKRYVCKQALRGSVSFWCKWRCAYKDL